MSQWVSGTGRLLYNSGMAAVIEPASKLPSAELIDLRDIRSHDLKDLLLEEIETWRETLDWDFQASAELVERFVDQRALNGYALIEHGKAFGYSYFVHDERKGLIGDLYVRLARRKPEHEQRLLTAVVEALMSTPYVTRIETQLMMLGAGHESIPGARFLKTYERNFMRIGLKQIASLRPGEPRARVHFTPWEDWHQEPAAHLIPESYRGHIDSRINDQYDTVNGARRFLYNIVQYPGCGSFFKPASCVALDRDSGKLCGLSLCSLVAPHAGHITQICVAPSHRGTGIGYELLRRSLLGLQKAGCRGATLTVTAANRDAVGLYERMGFATIRKFRAFVWEGF
jgi:ribosomal protein S18 acetylase RimI-like enzyme